MQKRVVYYDLLRVISIFAVIIIHIVGNTINTFNLDGLSAKIFNSISQLMYFAVPLFVMISGALFLNPDKTMDIKRLYSKNILRIVLCLFIFGMFYSLLEIYFNTKVININMIYQSFQNIITGNLWAHMWYLYLILGLYIVSPIIKKITEHCSLKEYQYILIILFIFNILLNDLKIYFNLEVAFNIPFTSPYLLYFMLGDYLSRYTLSNKLKYINYFLSLISVVLIIINNFILIFDYNLLQYTSFIIFSITISIFYLFKDKKIEHGKKMLQSISDCGLGIYLIHQFVINIIYKVLKFNIILKIPYIGLIIYVIIVFVISYVITYILRKIKLIKKYIL